MKIPHNCVYVLFSLKDKMLYTGFTSNLERRLKEHEQGHSKATSCRRPFRLLFCEYYLSGSDARRREEYFKTTKGKRTLRLMLRESLSDVSLG